MLLPRVSKKDSTPIRFGHKFGNLGSSQKFETLVDILLRHKSGISKIHGVKILLRPVFGQFEADQQPQNDADWPSDTFIALEPQKSEFVQSRLT